jgi:RNA polymerase primary sigma factor
VRRLLSRREGTLSLDAPVSGHGNGDCYIQNLPSPDDLDQVIEGHLQKAELDSWLRELSETEELVLRARFGFLNGRPCTLSEVSQQVGRSRERVRQIEKRALSTLRARALASLGSVGQNALGSSANLPSLAHCSAS